MATGLFNQRRNFFNGVPGYEKNAEKVIHSEEYSSRFDDRIVGKIVIVIGNTFSGADISGEISQTGKKVIM